MQIGLQANTKKINFYPKSIDKQSHKCYCIVITRQETTLKRLYGGKENES
nr:MAG TPA: hypothetical protein [Caudoviricetes sp.]